MTTFNNNKQNSNSAHWPYGWPVGRSGRHLGLWPTGTRKCSKGVRVIQLRLAGAQANKPTQFCNLLTGQPIKPTVVLALCLCGIQFPYSSAEIGRNFSLGLHTIICTKTQMALLSRDSVIVCLKE